MHTMNLNDMLRDPRLVVLRAAELDAIACEYRWQAACARRAAVVAEVAGDPVAMASQASRSEELEGNAAAIEAHRRELLARFAPSMTLDLTADDRGVYA